MKTVLSIISFTVITLLPSITLASNSGLNIYSSHCLACHQKDGGGISGVFPSLRTSTILVSNLQETVNTVVKGRRGTAMQAFGLQLNQEQLTSVITYIRSSYGKAETNVKSLSPLVASAINDLNIQAEINKKKVQEQKNELNNISDPNTLFAKSFSYEQEDAPLAQYGYKLLVDKFPTSNLMIKAIERLDKIESK